MWKVTRPSIKNPSWLDVRDLRFLDLISAYFFRAYRYFWGFKWWICISNNGFQGHFMWWHYEYFSLMLESLWAWGCNSLHVLLSIVRLFLRWFDGICFVSMRFFRWGKIYVLFPCAYINELLYWFKHITYVGSHAFKCFHVYCQLGTNSSR